MSEPQSSHPELQCRLQIINDFTKDNGTKDGTLSLRKLQMVENHRSNYLKIKKLSLGTPILKMPIKVILLVGAIGAGKTSLINMMVNFIFKIRFPDDFRVILIDDDGVPRPSEGESQTDFITAYFFNYLPGMLFEYNYVLIDTPGFGDSRGIKRDREVMAQLESFLKQELGIDHVDAVGLVTPASENRLPQTQRYIFDGLSSLFGKNIENNIFILVTFADGNEPPVLNNLKDVGIPYRGFFKFNNDATSHNVAFLWEENFQNLVNYFSALRNVIPASLSLTIEVLEERRELQAIILHLENQLQLGFAKLDVILNERSALEKVKSEIEECGNYEQEVSVMKINKIMLGEHEGVLNCTNCNSSCHSPCFLQKNANTEGCAAIANGMCVVCTGKCPWYVHRIMKDRIEESFTLEKKTDQELADRHNLALGIQKEKHISIQRMEEDINAFVNSLLGLIRKSGDRIHKLELIALRPNPLPTKEYIDNLIKAEIREMREGYRNRIELLEKTKREVALLSGICEVPLIAHTGGEILLNRFKTIINDFGKDLSLYKSDLHSICADLRIRIDDGASRVNSKATLKEKILTEFTINHGTKNGLPLKKLILTENSDDPNNQVRKFYLGSPSPNHQTKIVLLVGGIGSGKSTLINAIVNFIYGVDFADNYRLIVVDDYDDLKRTQDISQTAVITAYTFNYKPGMPFELNCTFIDTPGFGDARGINRDRETMSQLEYFLKHDCSINQVDGAGIVTPAFESMLSQTQKYVFDSLSSIFGRDIKDNIHIMATFAGAKDPAVLTSIQEAVLSYNGVYKFNNSVIYDNPSGRNHDQLGLQRQYSSNSNDSDDDEADNRNISKLFWEMNYQSLEKFYFTLRNTVPASLTLTIEVLEERRELQSILADLHNKIQTGLSKLSNLHKEKDMLSKITTDIAGCANYEEEIDVRKTDKIMLQDEECVTNCTKCNFSCHYPCRLPKNSNKEKCSSMKNGVCYVCPGKCPWTIHFDMDYRYKTSYTKEKRTIQEIFNRYNLAIHNQTSKQSIIERVRSDINFVARDIVNLITRIQDHLEKLEEIALTPNPISTENYIELLIESERMQMRPNFQKKIDMLVVLKQEVATMVGARRLPANAQSGGENIIRHFECVLSSESNYNLQ